MLVKNFYQTLYPPDICVYVVYGSAQAFLAGRAGKNYLDDFQMPLQAGTSDLPAMPGGTAQAFAWLLRARCCRGRLTRPTAIPLVPVGPGLPEREPRFPAPAIRDRYAAPGSAVPPEYVRSAY